MEERNNTDRVVSIIGDSIKVISSSVKSITSNLSSGAKILRKHIKPIGTNRRLE